MQCHAKERERCRETKTDIGRQTSHVSKEPVLLVVSFKREKLPAAIDMTDPIASAFSPFCLADREAWGPSRVESPLRPEAHDRRTPAICKPPPFACHAPRVPQPVQSRRPKSGACMARLLGASTLSPACLRPGKGLQHRLSFNGGGGWGPLGRSASVISGGTHLNLCPPLHLRNCSPGNCPLIPTLADLTHPWPLVPARWPVSDLLRFLTFL